MMDENNLQSSLDTYKLQLSQVETALQAAGDNEELTKLSGDLRELISLTEESLLSLKKSQLLSAIENQSSTSSKAEPNVSDLDAEFAAFQAAIAEDDTSEPQSTSTSSRATPDLDLDPSSTDLIQESLREIEGTKCRVAYTQPWGGKMDCNAMVVCAEPLKEDSEPKVRVLFCNPTQPSMLPCSFFLEGECKFDEDTCRFSHGYVVGVSELHEFKDPDYSLLKLEGVCLAKYHDDGLWYRGTVVEVDEGSNECQVMFDRYQNTERLSWEDVLPLGEDASSDEDEDDDDDDDKLPPLNERLSDEEDDLPVFLWKPPTNTAAMGEWEQFTKGIGSKLMARMGYVKGQGLGKEGKGRAEPVPIQLLPQGKSLDKIMQLKEIAGDRDLYDVAKADEKKSKKRLQNAAKGYIKKGQKKQNVFDFINKKLHGKKGNLHDLAKHHAKPALKKNTAHIKEADLKSKSDKHINLQIFKTHEEKKNVNRELSRLKIQLQRNEGTDRTIANQLRTKIANMEKYLQQLEDSEKSMTNHQKNRKHSKKMTIF